MGHSATKAVWIGDYSKMDVREVLEVAQKLQEEAKLKTPYTTPFKAEYAVYSVTEARFVEIISQEGVEDIKKQNAFNSNYRNKGYIIPIHIAAEMFSYQLQMAHDKRRIEKAAKGGK